MNKPNPSKSELRAMETAGLDAVRKAILDLRYSETMVLAHNLDSLVDACRREVSLFPNHRVDPAPILAQMLFFWAKGYRDGTYKPSMGEQEPAAPPSQAISTRAFPSGAVLIDLDDIKALGVKFSKTHLWRLIKNGAFPSPVSTGRKRRTWLKSDVEEWLASKIHERVK